MSRPRSGAELYPKLYNTRRWRTLRRNYLTDNPLCAMCQADGFPRSATELDHIEPHKGNRELFWSLDNLQGLCRYHHRVIKARMERGDPRRGTSADGLPLDPEHPWNTGEGGV